MNITTPNPPLTTFQVGILIGLGMWLIALVIESAMVMFLIVKMFRLKWRMAKNAVEAAEDRKLIHEMLIVNKALVVVVERQLKHMPDRVVEKLPQQMVSSAPLSESGVLRQSPLPPEAPSG